MHFSHVRRIDVTPNSIFYSLIRHGGAIIAFGRRHYGGERVIKKITLDEQFNIVEDAGETLRGEDPRCFEHNGALYVLDNFLSDMHLIDYAAARYTKIGISGKNPSFISHGGALYLVHYIKPFKLYTIDAETGAVAKVAVADDGRSYNYEYRGGTPGYRLRDNAYYGFGHRTYAKNGAVKHDVFMWTVFFDAGKPPRLSHRSVAQPPSSKNICDPTSVLEVGGKRYLITAESDKPWFCDQDYVTNVYEIHDEDPRTA